MQKGFLLYQKSLQNRARGRITHLLCEDTRGEFRGRQREFTQSMSRAPRSGNTFHRVGTITRLPFLTLHNLLLVLSSQREGVDVWVTPSCSVCSFQRSCPASGLRICLSGSRGCCSNSSSSVGAAVLGLHEVRTC